MEEGTTRDATTSSCHLAELDNIIISINDPCVDYYEVVLNTGLDIKSETVKLTMHIGLPTKIRSISGFRKLT